MTRTATRLAAINPSASMAASMAAKALRATAIDGIEIHEPSRFFPGTAGGPSPFFRISTATSDTTLAAATSRIARAVAALEPGIPT